MSGVRFTNIDRRERMEKIAYKGLEALCLNRISGGWDTGIIFLRIVGPQNAVRGIWADIVGADTRKSGSSNVTVDGSSVRFAKHTKYITVSKHLQRSGLFEMVFVHPDATSRLNEETRVFYLIAPDNGVPPAFFQRLDALLRLPLLHEWTDWLWNIGLDGVETGRYGDHVYKQQTITKLSPDVGDLCAYRVYAGKNDVWYKILLQGLGMKICNNCRKTCGHKDMEAVEEAGAIFCFECWSKKPGGEQ